MKFLLAPPPPPPKKESYFFVLEVVCRPYNFSLPDMGNCYFLVFQITCLNLTFTVLGVEMRQRALETFARGLGPVYKDS